MTQPPDIRFLDRSTPPHIATLVLLAGIAAMNMSAFLPSLPAMTEDFDASYAVMQLAVSGYLFVTAGLQLAVGPIADRFGRRPVTLISLAIFVVATLGCLVAPNAPVFLAFRMVSGVVAIGIVLSRAIVRDMVPQDSAASMIGYVTMGMALVPMVAPVIGGALGEALGWEAVFVFLALSGVAVMALAWFDQGETVPPGRALTFREQAARYPDLFRSLPFWGYVLVAAFAAGAFFGFLGGAPYVSTEVFGLSAVWSGVGFGAPAIGYAAGNFLSGRYSQQVGIDPLILLGSGLTAALMGLAMLLSLLGAVGPVVFFGFCTVVGLGNGLVMPNATAGMLSVKPELAGTASGLGSAIMIGGGAAMSVLAGVVLTGATTATPLLAIMSGTAVAGLLSILAVRWLTPSQTLTTGRAPAE